jgi:hypothetical protein
MNQMPGSESRFPDGIRGRRFLWLGDGRGEAFDFWAGFFVQSFGEFLQAGNNLGRLGQDRGRQFFRIVGTSLRHFRKRHHYSQSVVYRMLDFAVFSLQFLQLCVRNCLFAHSASISVEKSKPCA